MCVCVLERERETYLGRLENTPGSISSDSFSRRFLDGEGKNSETEEDDEVREERGEDDIFKIGKEQLRRMRQASKQPTNQPASTHTHTHTHTSPEKKSPPLLPTSDHLIKCVCIVCGVCVVCCVCCVCCCVCCCVVCCVCCLLSGVFVLFVLLVG